MCYFVVNFLIYETSDTAAEKELYCGFQERLGFQIFTNIQRHFRVTDKNGSS